MTGRVDNISNKAAYRQAENKQERAMRSTRKQQMILPKSAQLESEQQVKGMEKSLWNNAAMPKNLM